MNLDAILTDVERQIPDPRCHQLCLHCRALVAEVQRQRDVDLALGVVTGTLQETLAEVERLRAAKQENRQYQQEMHAAWRKRAEEAEAEVERLRNLLTLCGVDEEHQRKAEEEVKLCTDTYRSEALEEKP